MPPQILGINARNLLYIKPSITGKVRHILDNKLLTKKALVRARIPVPETFDLISSQKQLREFDWSKLPGSFALKPARGFGGAGILVVFAKKKEKILAPRIWFGKRNAEDAWIKADGKLVTVHAIQGHILTILDGAYSLGNLPDMAFFEERIKILKLFKGYSFQGIPDIRVIVCNSIPVMAQLRVPTKESQGKANLHLGAVGIGIDMGNGVTTHAVWHNRPIDYIPRTKLTTRGIKIPEWGEILELAIRASQAVCAQFVGADISIDRDRGPMILELNARPGLSIQLANMAPLRERLERVRGLSVRSPQKGAKIAQDLFGGGIEEELEELSGKKVIGTREQITIFGAHNQAYATFARIDTGAYRTTIDRSIAEKLHLTNIIKYKKVRGALGKQERPIIDLTFELDREKIRTEAFIAPREDLKYDIIVGRRDLKKFLIDPAKNIHLANP